MTIKQIHAELANNFTDDQIEQELDWWPDTKRDAVARAKAMSDEQCNTLIRKLVRDGLIAGMQP